VLGGRGADRWGPRAPLLAGWFIYAGIYLGFAAASAEWQAWTFFLGYALYYALAEPAEKVFASRLAGDAAKGLAFGWFNFVIGVAALPSSLIFGALYERFGAQAAFGWGAGLALAGSALLLGVRLPTTHAPDLSAERDVVAGK
jgi:MFS family permease